MSDPAEQLQRIYLAGFDVQQFERYPKVLGIAKGNCVALVQPTPDGLKLIGVPGWRLGETLGVLVEKDGRQVFQNKAVLVEATPERLAELAAFGEELQHLLVPSA